MKATKVILGVVGVLVLVFIFVPYMIGKNINEQETGANPPITADLKSTTDEPTEEITETTTEIKAEKPQTTDNNEISVELLSTEVHKEDNGDLILVLEYNFINNSGKEEAFMYTCIDQVYQNGVECNSVYTVDGVSAGDKTKKVQSGYSLTFKAAYKLYNANDDIEIIITKPFTDGEVVYLDEIITLENVEEAISQYEAENPATSIKIVSASISEDYSGAPVLVVEYEYYNGDDKATSFTFACQDTAFQNGIECSSSVFGCNDVDSQQQLNDVQSKATYTLKVGYLLSDTTTPINIVVTDLWGENEFINETISLE